MDASRGGSSSSSATVSPRLRDVPPQARLGDHGTARHGQHGRGRRPRRRRGARPVGVLTDLDLTSEVEPFIIPVDDAVTHLLVNPRAAAGRVADNLWVRVLDVPVALAGRQYAGAVDVVLHVTDARVPGNSGHWRLRATAFGEATCERTEDPADISLDVRELGSAYLGGVSLTSLAAAGLVSEHRPGTLSAASAAFGWPVAPVSSWVF
ncbi:sterol carrier protein domain-containing protein [Oerskovia sp. M15]